MTDFCQNKFFPVTPQPGEKLRTVFYSPNNIEVFNWLCQRSGIKKYRQARLWKLYDFLQYGDFIGVDKESIRLIRLKLYFEYRLLSDYVIEDDLRLLAKMGLIVESQTSVPPNIDAYREMETLDQQYRQEKDEKDKLQSGTTSSAS